MALYSVWDWNRNAWGVYRTNRPASVGDDPLPHRPSGASSIGADPDIHVKALPSGAKFVGYDHTCRGEVRRKTGFLGIGGDDAGQASGIVGHGWLMFAAGIVVASAYVWWRKT